MAIPQQSAQDRAIALEKAREARLKRAELRERIKAGTVTLAEILDMQDDPAIGRMKVSTLIETFPGYGKAKCERIMAQLEIAESRRIKGLGSRQKRELLERLS